ncbi:hypothetical protein PENTCL1PPCAC_16268, partial [Pristionchus entomophagus]
STTILIIGINALPFRYAAVSNGVTLEELDTIAREMCPSCDWIEKGLNFGILSVESARQVNAVIVLCTLIPCAVFGFACGGHITH